MSIIVAMLLIFVAGATVVAVSTRRTSDGRKSFNAIPLLIGVLALPAGFILLALVFKVSSRSVHTATVQAQNNLYDAQQEHVRQLQAAQQDHLQTLARAQAEQVEAHDGEPVEQRAASAASPAWWNALMNDTAVSRDPHTSFDTLKAFLAQGIAAQCEKLGSADGARRVIIGPNLSEEFEAYLNSELHAMPTDVFGKRPAEETWVNVQWQQRTERRLTWWPQRPTLKGTLVARITGPKGEATVTAKLDEKPWLEHTGITFGRSEYVVVRVPRLAQSAAEARSLVRREAVEALTRSATGHVRLMKSGGVVSGGTIRSQAESLLARNVGVLDDAVIRIDRPVGTVWIAAMLVDTSEVTGQPIATASVQSTVHQRQSFAAMILGMAGMIVVLGLVYAVLNALTRGYFRNQLRAIAVVGLVVAAAVIFLLIGG